MCLYFKCEGQASFLFLLFSLLFSCYVQLFATPRTEAHQAPLSTEFLRQEYWVGCCFLSQGIFPTPGSNPGLLHWQARSLQLVPPGQMHQRKRRRRRRGRPDRACTHEGEWDPWPTWQGPAQGLSWVRGGSHCSLRVPLPPSAWPAFGESRQGLWALNQAFSLGWVCWGMDLASWFSASKVALGALHPLSSAAGLWVVPDGHPGVKVTLGWWKAWGSLFPFGPGRWLGWGRAGEGYRLPFCPPGMGSASGTRGWGPAQGVHSTGRAQSFAWRSWMQLSRDPEVSWVGRREGPNPFTHSWSWTGHPGESTYHLWLPLARAVLPFPPFLLPLLPPLSVAAAALTVSLLQWLVGARPWLSPAKPPRPWPLSGDWPKPSRRSVSWPSTSAWRRSSLASWCAQVREGLWARPPTWGWVVRSRVQMFAHSASSRWVTLSR